MTFDDLWIKICEKNPRLLTGENVTMTVGGFCKALSLAYEHGQKQERDMRHSQPQRWREGQDTLDFLKRTFGI